METKQVSSEACIMMNNDVSDGKLAMFPWLPIAVRLLFAGLSTDTFYWPSF
jgi:hypothetical protein